MTVADKQDFQQYWDNNQWYQATVEIDSIKVIDMVGNIQLWFWYWYWQFSNSSGFCFSKTGEKVNLDGTNNLDEFFIN